jgi:hypothetical protein
MQKFDWKTLYFVLATLLGLVLIVIGVVSGVNTALTTYVFPIRSFPQSRPYDPPVVDVKKLEASEELTAEQKKALAQWEQDYKNWQDTESKYDYEAENRKRTIANAIAMILAGVPVFVLHAPHVFMSERKKK